MKKDIFEKSYDIHKQRKFKFIYVDFLCEVILERFLIVDNNITKKQILSELPGIRELKTKEVQAIYDKALKLLRLKYDIEVLSDDPFTFADHREKIK